MPVVPTLQPQVEINPSAPKFQSGGSQEQATATGRQIAAGGDALMRLGQGVRDIVSKEQAKANFLRLKDAENAATKYANELKYHPEDGYLNLKGDAAVTPVDGKALTERYSEKLRTRMSEIAGKLDNPYLREQFSLTEADLGGNFEKEAYSYEGAQAQVYAAQVNSSTLSLAAETIAANPANTNVVDKHIRDAKMAAANLAEDKGLDPVGTDLFVKEAMGKVHNAVITSLLESSQPKLAKAYFDAHEDDYTTLEAKAMSAKLKDASDAASAVDAVDRIWEKLGPRTTNAKLDANALDKALRDEFKDEPAMLKTARAEMSIRSSGWEFTENETNTANINAVMGRAAKGASLSELLSTPAWLALSGSDQDRITEMMKARSKRDQVEGPVSDAVFLNVQELWANSPKLAAMSPEDILAKLPEYGRNNVEMLLKRREALQQPGAVQSASLDQEDFNSIATRMGVPGVNKPYVKRSEAERLRISRLQHRLETLVGMEQDRTGRALSRVERQQLLEPEIARSVILDGAGKWGSDLRAAVIDMSSKQIGQTIVPPNEIVLAEAWLKAHELEVNDMNIRTVFLSRSAAGRIVVEEANVLKKNVEGGATR